MQLLTRQADMNCLPHRKRAAENRGLWYLKGENGTCMKNRMREGKMKKSGIS